MSRRRYEDITDDSEDDSNKRIKTVDSNSTLLVDADNFVEGSIVKMTLSNFVTYDYCEIYPGPQMNMIIGPNGTGKSTIVCAIALGLGGSPALLGRAKNIADFVKTGKDEATITIELKKLGDRNIIIQRSFNKLNNQTSWKLNGKTTAQRDITQIIASLNIQVDNLCQFLPQDRVSEFALLSPSQLLERTQSATGESEMYGMQMQLVKWRNEEKNLIRSHESDLDHIKTLRNRNAELEKDATRMRQRNELLDSISLLEAQIPLVKYTDSKKKLDELKAILKEKGDIVTRVKNVYKPIQRVIRECEREKADAAEVMQKTDSDYKEKVMGLIKVLKEVREMRNAVTSDKSQINTIKEKLPEKEEEINNKKRTIEKTEAALRNPPVTDTTELDQEIHAINEKLSEHNVELSEVHQQAKELSRKKNDSQRRADEAKKSIDELLNVAKMRLMKLRQCHSQTYEAFQWLRENRSMFRGKVYNPIMLEISLKDPNYAAAVEQCLGGARSTQFRTFLFEEREDYVKFTSIAVDQKKWKLSVAWPDRLSDHLLKTPISEERLKAEFGMDHFASKLIDGPEYVLKYLCSDSSLNQIPVSRSHVDVNRVVRSGLFKKFICGNSLYNVKKYSYGSGGTQTQVNIFKGSGMLTDTLDNNAKEDLKEQQQRHLSDIEQANVLLKELASQVSDINQKIKELKHQKEDKLAQKREVQSKAQQLKRLQYRLEQWKEELIELKNGPAEAALTIKRLEKQLLAELAATTTVIEKMTKLFEAGISLSSQRNIACLELEDAKAKHEAVAAYGNEQINELKEAERVLEMSRKQHILTEREVKRYMADSKEAGKEIPEHLVGAFREIVNQWKKEGAKMTKDELETEIIDQKAKADAIRFANPDAIKLFDERSREILRLESKAEKDGDEINELKDKIAELKARWEPQIEALVARISAKFSDAFERIGCTGEVGLSKNEDYDKWGIEIQVRFRDNEKLQVLNAHRQSGGEKAVSTILYLMSLQDLAKSPFRVVDEINQGMDARNERMIHEQIVQGASRPGTSQYFLITPKLLPDLYYNERIRVLCIYNGEWVPTKINPLSVYLKNAQKAKV